MIHVILKKMEEIEQGMTNVHPEALPLVSATYRELQKELDIEAKDLDVVEDCGKRNCTRPKLDGFVLCSYHLELAS